MITYHWMKNGMVMEGTWEGNPNLALEAAIEHLGAWYDPGSEGWIYRAPESGELVILEEDELLEAGAAIMAGVPDWYTVWCANAGAPVR